MKKHKVSSFVPSAFGSVLTLLAAANLYVDAQASVIHSDVPLQTYVDFGQNKGRYAINANALLTHIRERDGGIVISYTDGTAPWKISNAQGMINFSATDDIGAQVVVAPNMTATVFHNGSINASFGHREIGTNHAVNYSAIDIRGSEIFRLSPKNATGGSYDYMVQRQNKIVTDATWNPLTNITDMSTLVGEHAYHSGAGTMGLWNESSNSQTGLAGAYQYIVGGINRIDNAQTHAGTTNISVHQNPNFGNRIGASLEDPLPNAIQGGDSGSPIFIYNKTTQQYEYIAAQQSRGGNSYGQARGNVTWTHEIIESFNVRPDMNAINEIRLEAITHKGETKTDAAGRTSVIYYGKVTDSRGNVLGEYNGIQSGQHTWKDLSDIKNRQNWYAYDSEAYLQQKDEALFFNENLSFTASRENNNIILSDTVDLGIGYVEFNSGDLNNAIYNIKSESSESNLLNSAGYVVNKNAIVHLYLTNPANYMYEWRKIGAGDLYIRGNGDTNALLSVGGSGNTYLQRENGHAAYNVLISGGATVVIENTKQIARDLTFGNGGGTLDMNGNSMEWKLSNTNISADGFSINALTEDAVIANKKGAATLTFSEAGNHSFSGSFRDTASSSLRIIYDAGLNSVWTLHSTSTNLQNAGSKLDIRSGNVVLAGTLTEHGTGSASGKNTTRYTHQDDWHYADAKMNVMIGGAATFTLGSHARLTGNVEVMRYGVFVMNEGVKHQHEYIEGGTALEDTYAISDFYGLKGNVHLYQGSEMRVIYSAGTTANTTYAGTLSGNGNMLVNLGSSGGSFTLAGNNVNYKGQIVIESGTLRLGGKNNALGMQDQHGWGVRYAAVIKNGATLDVNGQLAGGENCYKIELAGGALVNNGADLSTYDRQVTRLRLSANSEIGGSGDFGLIGSGYYAVTLELGGHKLTKTGENTFFLTNSTVTSGTLQINEGILDIAERSSDASAADLVLAGGKLKLSAGNNFSVKSVSGVSGTIEIGAGTLNIVSDTATGTFSGDINFTDSGKITFNAGTHDWSGAKILSGNSAIGRIEISGNGTLVKADVLGKQAISVGQNATLETRAVSSGETADMSGVSGNGKVALKLRDGNGRGFDLSAFTGTIEVGKDSGAGVGRLRLNTSKLNSSAKIRVLSGGELVFDGTGTQIKNNISFDANAKIHANHLKNGEISGKISFAGGVVLTKAGAGVLTLSGNNSEMRGDIIVSAGTLKATSVQSLGVGKIRVNKGAKIHLAVENTEGFSGITLATGATLIISEKLAEELAGIKTENGKQTEVDLETIKTTINNGNVEFLATEEIAIIHKSKASLLPGISIEPKITPVASLMSRLSFQRTALVSESEMCPTCVSIVPEPSAFCLLTGLGTLALVASRRRRH